MIFRIDNKIITQFFKTESLWNNKDILPFLHLKSFNKNYNSLIFCINDNHNIDIWRIFENKSYKFVCNISISNFQFILPLLVNCNITEIKRLILTSIENCNKLQKEIINNIINNLNEKLDNIPLSYINNENFNKLTNTLFETYIDINNKLSFNDLFNFINKHTTQLEFNKIKLLFQTFQSQLGKNYTCIFGEFYKYSILRELICVVTGKHVVCDPFTFNYVFSECAIVCTIGNYYSRLIKYKSESGIYFIERRGPGWIDITSSIILQNGLIIDPRYWCRHDAHRPDQFAISSEEEPLIKNLFDCNISLEEEKDHQYLIINVDYSNLGHTLWNEVSGYVEFALLCHNSKLEFKNILPLLPPSIPNNFSKLGSRAYFYPYIKKSLYNYVSKKTHSNIIKNYINSISDLPINNFFSIKRQPVSLRFPQMSKLVSDTIANDFPDIKKTKIHIYKNIRFHNKSQTNVIECLSKFLEKLTEQKDLGLKPEDIEIDLEFSSDTVKGPSFQAHDYVNNIINKIKLLCDQYNVKLNLHDSYDIPELMKLISGSDICIVPIGSGAILPTWIFNKYTVMHANQSHYTQLEWWNQVGNIENNNQFIIDPDKSYDVLETAGSLYSNYSIDPDSYSDTIIKSLKAYCSKTH